jgi:NADPH-dependent ferric siderophore reductase
VPFERVARLYRDMADAHDLELRDNTDDRMVLRTVYGDYEVVRRGAGVAVELRSESRTALHIIKDALVQQVEGMSATAAEGLRWTDDMAQAGPPPNFQMTKVLSVEELRADFVRLHLQVFDLSDYTDESLHFRFLLPPPGGTPEWPSLKHNGGVTWPKGAAKLHTPVYTARAVDLSAGLLVVDVFRHEGGRMTELVKQLSAGDEIAIMGPGGGGVPRADRLHFFGDQTAYPAIARCLDVLDPGAGGRVTLLGQDALRYPFPEAPEFVFEVLPDEAALREGALACLQELGEAYLWFAAEQSAATEVRGAFKATGLPRDRAYIAGYWAR